MSAQPGDRRPLAVEELDLSAGVPAFQAPVAADRYVVLWWRDIPLGHVELEGGATLDTFWQLAATAVTASVETYLAGAGCAAALQQGPFPGAFLARIQQLEQALQPPQVRPSVSVVICTRDRTQQLDHCLRSLARLSVAADEVIVVDNAPATDATRQLVAAMQGVTYVQEPRPGLDIARNTGWRHSRSEIVAYIDDDVTVHRQWVRGVWRGFQHPDVMAVTGLVLAAELRNPSQRIFERYWSFNRGYRPVTYGHDYFRRYRALGVPTWRIGAGANMAFRRSTFEELGGFDERLDVGAAGCSGDSEFWYRVLARGWTCRYEPTAVAYHSHRASVQDLRRQLFYYMRGHVAALLVRYERSGDIGNLIHVCLLAPHYLKTLLLGWRQGPGRYRTLGPEVRGCISGLRYYWRHRRRGC